MTNPDEPVWPEKTPYTHTDDDGDYGMGRTKGRNETIDSCIAAFEEWRKEQRPTPTPIDEKVIEDIVKYVTDESLDTLTQIDKFKDWFRSLLAKSQPKVPSVEEIAAILLRWDSVIADKGLAEDIATAIHEALGGGEVKK